MADSYESLEHKANKVLEECNKWLICNRLTLNVDKTHYLLFRKKSNNIPRITLKIDNTMLEEKNSTKYLGLILQNNLNWNEHISMVTSNLNKTIPMWIYLRNFLDEKTRIVLYKSLCISKINYAIEIYGRKDTQWRKQLQKTQNRLLKILFYKDRLHKTNLLHRNLHILKVSEQNKLRLALLIHRKIYFPEFQPPKLCESIALNNRRNLRSTINAAINTNSFNYKNRVIDSAAITWNEIPNYIKNTKNRETFKSLFTNECLNMYNDE